MERVNLVYNNAVQSLGKIEEMELPPLMTEKLQKEE